MTTKRQEQKRRKTADTVATKAAALLEKAAAQKAKREASEHQKALETYWAAIVEEAGGEAFGGSPAELKSAVESLGADIDDIPAAAQCITDLRQLNEVWGEEVVRAQQARLSAESEKAHEAFRAAQKALVETEQAAGRARGRQTAYREELGRGRVRLQEELRRVARMCEPSVLKGFLPDCLIEELESCRPDADYPHLTRAERERAEAREETRRLNAELKAEDDARKAEEWERAKHIQHRQTTRDMREGGKQPASDEWLDWGGDNV